MYVPAGQSSQLVATVVPSLYFPAGLQKVSVSRWHPQKNELEEQRASPGKKSYESIGPPSKQHRQLIQQHFEPLPLGRTYQISQVPLLVNSPAGHCSVGSGVGAGVGAHVYFDGSVSQQGVPRSLPVAISQ